MRLKSLSIKGFKSFADPVKIDFDERITYIAERKRSRSGAKFSRRGSHGLVHNLFIGVFDSGIGGLTVLKQQAFVLP